MEHRTRSHIVTWTVAFTLLASVPAATTASSARIAWNDLPREPSWTADVPKGTALFPPAFFAGGVAVGTNRGVAVFPRRCRPRCEPLWHSELPGGPSRMYEVAADADVVVASDGEDQLAVFPADCRNDGAACEPAWAAEGRFLQPTLHDDAIVALISEGRRAGLTVFPVSCDDPCTPTFTWTRRRESWLLVDIVIANDVAYFVMNPRLYGVSLGCGSGGACGLVFRAHRGDAPTTPAVVDGRIVFTSGAESSEVAAYDEDCVLPCEPAWTATTEYSEVTPDPGPGLVFTTSRNVITAWPADCADPCQAGWTARMPGGPTVGYVTDRWVVAMSYGDRRVAVFPVDCDDPCRPAWSKRFRRQVYAVSGVGNDVAVTLDRRALGFPLWCGARCDPAWRGRLPKGEPWWPDTRRSSVVVYARANFDGGGVLSGFLARSG
ncbi:MAG: hypothetical protein ACXWXN_11040 [Actinomycetota bacterium]